MDSYNTVGADLPAGEIGRGMYESAVPGEFGEIGASEPTDLDYREVALNAAVGLYDAEARALAGVGNGEIDFGDVLDVARTFEKYLRNG